MTTPDFVLERNTQYMNGVSVGMEERSPIWRWHLLAACMMHMEGYYSTKSLAFKNCNPGNIEQPAGAYQVYAAPLDSYQALVFDIAANQGKTLREFISKYAPSTENNTSLYLDVVSTLSGIGKDETL